MWHDPADGKLGTLYYNSAEGDKTKSTATAFPVSTLKDVFVGKQCPELKSDIVKDSPSNVCFSLVTDKQTGAGLHLIAKDEQTRAATLATIKGFWEKRKPAAAAAAVTAAPSPTAEGATNSTATQMDAAAQNEAEINARVAQAKAAAQNEAEIAARVAQAKADAVGLAQQQAQAAPTPTNVVAVASTSAAPSAGLEAGRRFTAHSVGPDGKLTSAPVLVFLTSNPSSDAVGTLHWCEDSSDGERREIPGNELPLKKVQDVFLGKHAAIKNAPGAEKLNKEQCFTLASKGTTVNLEARSAQERKDTIDEIKSRFQKSGLGVEDTKPASRPVVQTGAATSSYAASSTSSEGLPPTHFLILPDVPTSPRNHDAAGSTGAMSPATLERFHAQPLPVVAAPIADGQDFEEYRFSDAKHAQLNAREVHVWWENDSSLGCLYWAEGKGNRTKNMAQRLPLAEVTDVFVGKHVEEFQHRDAGSLSQDRCISLRSQSHPDHNLNLVAASAQIQRRWIRGLRKAFSENPETVIETRPVAQGQTPAEAVSSPKSSRVIQSKLATLAEGHPITYVSEQGETSDATLWFDPAEGRAGTLYYGADKSTKDASKAIPIRTVSDVFLGKKTPALRHASVANYPASTAFSVASKSRKLDAFARDEKDRKAILDGLQAAIHNAGTPVREYQHGKQSSNSSNTAHAVAQPGSNAITANSALRSQLAYIERGEVVLLHYAKGAQPRPVFLWYEPGYGKQGALFWSDVKAGQPAGKQKQGKQALLLQQVSDVMAGKQSDILKASPSTTLRSENSFTLLTTSGPRLDIQAATRQEREEWLNGVKAVFGATQKKIVEGGGAPNTRRLQPGTVVETWYGRGAVVHPTRKDGITGVDVGGTICYFNTESCKVVPMLVHAVRKWNGRARTGRCRSDRMVSVVSSLPGRLRTSMPRRSPTSIRSCNNARDSRERNLWRSSPQGSTFTNVGAEFTSSPAHADLPLPQPGRFSARLRWSTTRETSRAAGGEKVIGI